MNGPPNRTDDGTVHDRIAGTDGNDPADPAAFDAIVVRYESGNDRCTFVPHNGTTEEKLNAWLTVDFEAVVDLDDVR
ncbi:DUF7511 domain-containing protein [Natrinema ejinorense]|uniref:DUF7511 domain-containing protein n=1 Tax=Natrinema ejinorense TaxID=373386 RepID=A0A2A5QZP5_9EURY|nr:hypothetical protein [Natrinema ejinorense]PCR92306.1 hypothetical protein CP557_18300 [Natrinema ejinorense]